MEQYLYLHLYIVTLNHQHLVLFASTTKQKSVHIVSPLSGQSGRRGLGGVRGSVMSRSVVEQLRGDTPELLAFTCVVA